MPDAPMSLTAVIVVGRVAVREPTPTVAGSNVAGAHISPDQASELIGPLEEIGPEQPLAERTSAVATTVLINLSIDLLSVSDTVRVSRRLSMDWASLHSLGSALHLCRKGGQLW